MPSKKKKQNNRRLPFFLVSAVVGIAIICLGVTGVSMVTGRYRKQTIHKDLAVAKAFYFTSDLLSDSETIPTTKIAPVANSGNVSGSVSFTLRNHADALRYSEVDIQYTVAISTTDGNSGGTLSSYSGNIGSGPNQDDTITASNLEPGKTYRITATATAPYAKTLKGDIAVAPLDEALHANITKQTENLLEVTVWTVDGAGNATVSYAGLIPDNTNSNMADWKTADGSKQIHMERNSSVIYRFFKTGTTKTYQVQVNGWGVTINEQQG